MPKSDQLWPPPGPVDDGFHAAEEASALVVDVVGAGNPSSTITAFSLDL